MTACYATYYTIPPIAGVITSPGPFGGGGMCSPGAFTGVATFGGFTNGAMSGGGTASVPGFVNFTVPGAVGSGYYVGTITIAGLGLASSGSIWDVILDSTTSLGITTVVAQTTATPSGTVNLPPLAAGTTHSWSVVNLSESYVGELFTLPGQFGHAELNSTTGTFTSQSCCFTMVMTFTLASPVMLGLVSHSDTSLTVNWNSGSGAIAWTSYNLRYRRSTTADAWTTISGLTSNSTTVTGLRPGMSYDFEVEGSNGAIPNSGFSSALAATADIDVPTFPSFFTSVALSGGPGTSFTFALNTTTVSGTLLCVVSSANGTTPPTSNTITGPGYTWTKISSQLITGIAITGGGSVGQMYVDFWWGVATLTGVKTMTLALTGASTSAGYLLVYSANITNLSSNIQKYDDNPSLPQALSALSAGTQTVTFSTNEAIDLLVAWMVVSGTTVPTPPSDWFVVDCSAGQPPGNTTFPPLRIVPYVKNVITQQTNQSLSLTTTAGSITNVFAFTSVITPPTYLSFLNPTPGTLVAHWTAAAGANSYTIQYRQTGTTPFTQVTVTSTTATITGLSTTTTYDFQIQSNGFRNSSTFTPIQEEWAAFPFNTGLYYASATTIPAAVGALSTSGPTVGGLAQCGSSPSTPGPGGTVTTGPLKSGGDNTASGQISFTLPGVSASNYNVIITVADPSGFVGDIWDIILDGARLGTTNVIPLSGTANKSYTAVLPGGSTHTLDITDLLLQYAGITYTLPGLLGVSADNDPGHGGITSSVALVTLTLSGPITSGNSNFFFS